MVTRIGPARKRPTRVHRVKQSRYNIVSKSEGEQLFDAQTRRALGISGEEFLSRWDQGQYRNIDDDAVGRKVQRLAMLIPFARRTKA